MWRITPDQQLLLLSDDRPGVVWVPSDEMVFFRAELPERKQLWSQVVSFALEEKLIHSVESIHFAVGTPDDQEGVPVATVPLTTIERWMALLKTKSIKPVAIYPDFMAIPTQEEQVVVWHESDRCFIRLSAQEGINASLEWSHILLTHTKADTNLCIFSDNPENLPAEWAKSAKALPMTLEQQMIQISKTLLPMNLMWGHLSPSSETWVWLRPWSRVAMVLFALIPLYLGDLHLKTRSFDAQTKVLDRVIEKTLQEYFPNQTMPKGNFRAYMSRLINQVQLDLTQTQNSTWQAMLALDVVLSSCKPCQVEAIKLTKSRLSLDIATSKDTQSIVALLKKFTRWKITSEKLTNAGQRKQIRIILSPQREG